MRPLVEVGGIEPPSGIHQLRSSRSQLPLTYTIIQLVGLHLLGFEAYLLLGTSSIVTAGDEPALATMFSDQAFVWPRLATGYLRLPCRLILCTLSIYRTVMCISV